MGGFTRIAFGRPIYPYPVEPFRENVLFTYHLKEKHMSLGMIVLIVLILLLVGAIPSWPHSRGWGYGPSGGLGLVVLVLIVLLLMGKL